MADTTSLSVTVAAPRSIAAIGAYRDRDAVLAALHAELGVPPPTAPRFIEAAGVMLTCLAPGRYFATAERSADLAARLRRSLSGVAAITDQSDLWHMVTVAGRQAAEALSRLVPIDLDAAAFPVGAAALTRAGHLDIRLWHLAEQTYEVAVARSYAEDLRHAVKGEGHVLF